MSSAKFFRILSAVSILLLNYSSDCQPAQADDIQKSPAKIKHAGEKSKLAKGSITEKQALDLVSKMPEVKQFFALVTKSKIAKPTIDVDRKEGENFVVHVYEIVNDGPETAHTATKNWYYVNCKTGKITKEF